MDNTKLYVDMLYTFCMSIMAASPESDEFLDAWKSRISNINPDSLEMAEKIVDDVKFQLETIRSIVDVQKSL